MSFFLTSFIMSLLISAYVLGEETNSNDSKVISTSEKERTKIYITIKVSEEMARNLHQRGSSTPELKELIKLEKEFNVAIEPMHPYSDNSRLDPYFVVRIPEHATTEEMLTRFRQCKMIEAAYIKPPDELP